MARATILGQKSGLEPYINAVTSKNVCFKTENRRKMPVKATQERIAARSSATDRCAIIKDGSLRDHQGRIAARSSATDRCAIISDGSLRASHSRDPVNIRNPRGLCPATCSCDAQYVPFFTKGSRRDPAQHAQTRRFSHVVPVLKRFRPPHASMGVRIVPERFVQNYVGVKRSTQFCKKIA